MSSPYGRARSLGYQPQLDGVRALAVLAVMAYHASHNIGIVGRPKLIVGGFLGVDIFFVLSGYLITSLLVYEWDNRNAISLGNFYARRALRSIPALILAIAFAALVVKVTSHNFQRPFWESALATVSYLANWFQISEPLAPLGHTWSLSIEEQYYIVWPALLLIGLRTIKGRRTLAGVTFALAACMAVARYMTYEGGDVAMAALSTFTRPDGLLIGSGLALLLADPPQGLVDFLRRRDVALCALAVLGMSMLTFRWAAPELYRGGLLFVNIATALLVGHLALTRSSFINRMFSTQPLPAIGRISYGLYLFHVPVLYLLTDRQNGKIVAVMMFLLTFAIATGSFLLIEAPILKLKKRFGSVSALSDSDQRQTLART